jgi:hypothetical protein
MPLMRTLLNSGKWLFVYSFSFYVFLHLFAASVGVEKYVPAYLPFPYVFNYGTGICLLAFMVSCTLGKYDAMAAVLLAGYLLLVTVLIHLPRAAEPMEMLNVFRITNMMGGALMYALAFAHDKRPFRL